ncbi:MAG TPA: phytoene/squalene synthase family protein [Stellaceae bacterium]|jgi:phytoene synthase|nr:phytoene/squalene synthase family protein [Stellaceae bacterium]
MSDSVLDASRDSIRRGSTSFAAAARLFDPRIREDAYMLYAWCRHCDDEIDGQVMGHGAVGLDPILARRKLAELEDKTRRAMAGEPTDDTAFAAFQRVAQRHGIAAQHPLDLLQGFRMDVEGRSYRTLQDTLLYAYHVAGVVGVMMAQVMGVRDIGTLRRASDLGLALQLTNIARDVIEDAKVGRIYLPADWLGAVANSPAAVIDPANRDAVFAATERLLAAAEPYYASSRWGLKALGFRSAWAIAAARGVYRQIGVKVAAMGPAGMDRRASTGAATKLMLVLRGGLVAARAVTSDGWQTEPDRTALWAPF